MSHTSIRCRSSPNPEQTSCEKQFTKQRGVTVSLLPPAAATATGTAATTEPTAHGQTQGADAGHRGRLGRGAPEPALASALRGVSISGMTLGQTPGCSLHCHSSHLLGFRGSVIWPFCGLGLSSPVCIMGRRRISCSFFSCDYSV